MADVKGGPFPILVGVLQGHLTAEELLFSKESFEDLATLIEVRRMGDYLLRYGFSEAFVRDLMTAAKDNFGVRDLVLLWRDAETTTDRAAITADLRAMTHEVLSTMEPKR
jgi:hypothetical protein